MTYSIAIGCEQGGSSSSCGWISWEARTPDALPSVEILKGMAERGWVERDSKHYCPRHDPDKAGEVVQISMGYVEIAPGVFARWPGARQEGDSIPIEVRTAAPGQPQQPSGAAGGGASSEQ